MASLQKKLEDIYKSDLQNYYSGDNVDVFIDNFYLDECTMIGWRSVVNNSPVYAYNAELFNSIMQGTFRVEGKFAINFKSTGYLEYIMERAATARANNEYTPLGRLSDLKPQLGFQTRSDTANIDPTPELNKNRENFLNAALFDPRNRAVSEAELNDVRRKMRDFIWGYVKAGEESLINSIRDSLKGRYFDITMVIGNPNSDEYDVKNIVDAMIIDVSVEVNKSIPIALVYTFVARDTDRPQSAPNPFDFIQANRSSIQSLNLGANSFLEYLILAVEKYADVNVVDRHVIGRTSFEVEENLVPYIIQPAFRTENETKLKQIHTINLAGQNLSLFPFASIGSSTTVEEIHTPMAVEGARIGTPEGNFIDLPLKPVSVEFEEVAFAGITIDAPPVNLVDSKIRFSDQNIAVLPPNFPTIYGLLGLDTDFINKLFGEFYGALDPESINAKILEKVRYFPFIPGDSENLELDQMQHGVPLIEKDQTPNIPDLADKLAYSPFIGKKTNTDVESMALDLYLHKDIEFDDVYGEYKVQVDEQMIIRQKVKDTIKIGPRDLERTHYPSLRVTGDLLGNNLAGSDASAASDPTQAYTFVFRVPSNDNIDGVSVDPVLETIREDMEKNGLRGSIYEPTKVKFILEKSGSVQDQVEFSNMDSKESKFETKRIFLMASDKELIVMIHLPALSGSLTTSDGRTSEIAKFNKVKDILLNADGSLEYHMSMNLEISKWGNFATKWLQLDESGKSKPIITGSQYLNIGASDITVFDDNSGANFDRGDLEALRTISSLKLFGITRTMMKMASIWMVPIVLDDRNVIAIPLQNIKSETFVNVDRNIYDEQKQIDPNKQAKLAASINAFREYQNRMGIFFNGNILDTNNNLVTDWAHLIGSYLTNDDYTVIALEPSHNFDISSKTVGSALAEYTIEEQDDMAWISGNYDPLEKLYKTLEWFLYRGIYYKSSTEEFGAKAPSIKFSAFELQLRPDLTTLKYDPDAENGTNHAGTFISIQDVKDPDVGIPKFVGIINYKLSDKTQQLLEQKPFGSHIPRLSSSFWIDGVTLNSANGGAWNLEDKKAGLILEIANGFFKSGSYLYGQNTNAPTGHKDRLDYNILIVENSEDIMAKYIKHVAPHVILPDPSDSNKRKVYSNVQYDPIDAIGIETMHEVHMEGGTPDAGWVTIGDNNLHHIEKDESGDPTLFNYDDIEWAKNASKTKDNTPTPSLYADVMIIGTNSDSGVSIDINRFYEIYKRNTTGFLNDKPLYTAVIGEELFHLVEDNDTLKEAFEAADVKDNALYKAMRINLSSLPRLFSTIYSKSMFAPSKDVWTFQFVGYELTRNGISSEEEMDPEQDRRSRLFGMDNPETAIANQKNLNCKTLDILETVANPLAEGAMAPIHKDDFVPITIFASDTNKEKIGSKWMIVAHNGATGFHIREDYPIRLFFAANPVKREVLNPNANKRNFLLIYPTLVDGILYDYPSIKNVIAQVLMSGLYVYFTFDVDVSYIYDDVNAKLPSEMAKLNSTRLQIKQAIADVLRNRIKTRMEDHQPWQEDLEKTRATVFNTLGLGDKRVPRTDRGQARALKKTQEGQAFLQEFLLTNRQKQIQAGGLPFLANFKELFVSKTGLLASYLSAKDEFDVIINNVESDAETENNSGRMTVRFAIRRGKDETAE